MSNHNEVAGLPQFARYLSSFPDPHAVARALVLGPLTRFQAASASIAVLDGPDLRLVSAHGYAPEVVDRYRVLPRSIGTPFSRALEEGEVVVDSFAQLLEGYRGLEVDRDIWEAIYAETGNGIVVSSPVVAEGFPVGAFGFIAPFDGVLTSLDFSLLDGISALLGMWLTHPRSQVEEPGVLRVAAENHLHLSERQQRILELVEQGKSNGAIAFALGYSVSTVKQEMQRALRTLRVNDRWAAVRRARELGLVTDRHDAS